MPDSAVLSSLPQWMILVIAVIAVSYRFIERFLERQDTKKKEALREEYRNTRPSVQLPPDRLQNEDTGRHELRTILDEEREREQRQEILVNTRQHGELLARLVAADEQSTQLLRRIVDGQERQTRALEHLSESQERLVRVLGGGTGQAIERLRSASKRKPATEG